MTETQLQSKIVIAYSQQYPERKGRLIHVPNERNHKIQAFQAKAIGIYAGVADLLEFRPKFKSSIAIELKIKGSRHKVEHLRKQIEWGRIWESLGNKWRLCTTVDQAMSCFERDYKGLTLDEAEQLIKGVKTQTIKI